MNKKYLSVILFGALMLGSTGTFTSCKDYDDDITNLQDQIDKLATKEDMEAKLSQMQTSIDAAKTAADAALAKAEEALKKAEEAGDQEAIENMSKEVEDLKDRVKALEDAAIDVEALKNDIKTATDEQLADFRKTIEKMLTDMETKLGLTVGDMVTSVELVYSFTSPSQDDEPELKFTTATVANANVFEEGIANAIEFAKGEQRQTESSFIVRVSPADAELTPNMISLVNSKGENLDNMLTITKVERYDGLLTRAAENSGLWTVTAKLTSYNEDAFNKATKTKVNNEIKSILFAAQVNNTPGDENASRYVTSSYDLTLAWKNYEPVATLNYFVNEKNINEINNRYTNTGCKSLTDQAATITYKEYTWKDGKTAIKGIYEGNGINAVVDTEDNRATEMAYPAVQGQEIEIALTSSDDEIVAPENIRAMYVTLDYEANAVESAPSEWNAWNSYKYEGLNTVVEGTKTTIKIDSDKAINDFIGFRVYAVNHDGTLVDPDGKAFYVKVGDVAVDWNAVNTIITPDADKDTDPSAEQSAEEAVTLTKLTGATKATWTTDKIGDNAQVFNAVFAKADGTTFSTASMSTLPTDFDKYVKVYTVPTIDDWTKYVDNKTYNGTLTISNADGFVLATIKVSMTKQLPTAPEGFSVKTNQLDEKGVYNCYLVPNDWTAPNAVNGTMDMDHVFNWGTGLPAQYVISFAEAAMDNNKVVANNVNGDADLEVAKNFIDNTKQHATTVSYNFGKISSEAKDAQGQIIEYLVEVETFPTVFNCIYNTTYSWHWGTIEEIAKAYGNEWAEKNADGSYKYKAPSTDLVYGTNRTFETPKSNTPFSFNEVILGVSSRDGLYSAWLSEPYKQSLKFKEAHVISKGNGVVDEYFKVIPADGNGVLSFEATQTSVETNPTANVPSTLKMVYTDMYGHDVVIELDMTVIPR